MKLKPADISIGVAIIPTPPLKHSISKASLRVSERYENKNLIDNKRFPAHLSLFLGGVTGASLLALVKALASEVKPFLSENFEANRLTRSHTLISVGCRRDTKLLELVDCVVKTCGQIHIENPAYRPHIIKRWPNLSSQQQELLQQFGTYKTSDTFNPHLSVADVADDIELESALLIAKKMIKLPVSFGIEAIQLVDIGHQNEQWQVLESWALDST